MNDFFILIMASLAWLTCGVVNHLLSDKTFTYHSDGYAACVVFGYVLSPVVTLWYIARALGIGVFAAIETVLYEDGRENWRHNRHQRKIRKEQRKLEVQRVVNQRIELETKAVRLKEDQAGLVRID